MCFLFPSSHVEHLMLKVMALGGGALMSGINALIKETPERSSTSSAAQLLPRASVVCCNHPLCRAGLPSDSILSLALHLTADVTGGKKSTQGSSTAPSSSIELPTAQHPFRLTFHCLRWTLSAPVTPPVSPHLCSNISLSGNYICPPRPSSKDR